MGALAYTNFRVLQGNATPLGRQLPLALRRRRRLRDVGAPRGCPLCHPLSPRTALPRAAPTGRLLPERELSAGETNPGRIPAQYAEALAQAAAGGREADARALAAEAYELFWEPVARVSPLPRSLDRPTRLPGGAPGPNFYSSTLGGAWLAAELLGQYQRDRDGAWYCRVEGLPTPPGRVAAKALFAPVEQRRLAA